MAFGRGIASIGMRPYRSGRVVCVQRPFRQFNGVEYSIGDIPMPSDWQEKTEWAFARLMFPPAL